MTTHELARRLLGQPDTTVMVSIDDWVFPIEDVGELDDLHTRAGTVVLEVGDREIIE